MANIVKSPKAYRNKKQGYKLNVNAARDKFLGSKRYTNNSATLNEVPEYLPKL